MPARRIHTNSPCLQVYAHLGQRTGGRQRTAHGLATGGTRAARNVLGVLPPTTCFWAGPFAPAACDLRPWAMVSRHPARASMMRVLTKDPVGVERKPSPPPSPVPVPEPDRGYRLYLSVRLPAT